MPYLAGAGRSLADSAQRVVQSAAKHLITSSAKHGAPKRVILGLGGFLAIMLPGITALLCIVAARAALLLRVIVAIGIGLLGAASYFYQGGGKATGALLLALVIGGLVVVFSGPLIAAPLAGLAGLIGGEFLPALLLKHRGVTQAQVNAVHVAIFSHPGTPLSLQMLLLIAAVIPFAFAARLIIKS